VRRANLPTDLDAGHPARVASHADVEDGHVGFQRRDPLEGLLRRRRLAHDDDVVLDRHQVAHPPTYQLVVVEEEHARRHVHIVPSPRHQ